MMAPPIFGRATITFGIGPHSSYFSIVNEIKQKCIKKKTQTFFETSVLNANAERDGRPAEHRWRPLVNAAKFG